MLMQDKLSHILKTINQLGGETRQPIFTPPAKEIELKAIEKQLQQNIPADFRQALLSISSHCEMSWFLPDGFELFEPFQELFSGHLHWEVDALVEMNRAKDNLIKAVFPDPTDDYDQVWHQKFVFQEVGNGDYLSIDLRPEQFGKVIYLSHDDGEGHGCVMADSFSELLDRWIAIGCVGAEDWQWLPFTADQQSGILPQSETARDWQQLIQLDWS